MRHKKKGRKLGRNASHRLAMFRNLTMSLIRHERIITTVEKAKELRPFVEKLITLAKKGQLHHRRLVESRLGSTKDAEVNPEGDKDGDHNTVLQKLFNEIGPRFRDRAGGYTRIIKRHQRRLGDGGKTAYIELLKEGETRSRAKAPSAPRVEERKAPTVKTEEPAPEQQPTSGEQAQMEQPKTEQAQTEQANQEQKPEGEQPKA